MPKATSIHFMFHYGAYPSDTEDILNDLRTAWSDEETGRNFAEGGAKYLEASDRWCLDAFVEALRSLKLSKVHKVPAADWRTAFATCPELHTIAFSDSRSLSRFITALQVDFNDTKKNENSPNSGPSGAWLPGLKTIQFRDDADPRESYDREPLDQKLARRLIETLRKRIQISSPTQEGGVSGLLRVRCQDAPAPSQRSRAGGEARGSLANPRGILGGSSDGSGTGQEGVETRSGVDW
ncbi:hypothetical protein FA13DRAFT_1792531 [Coprinellus micaceus]|uniref:Uncharacterized protein n=1 Tax=Coprinellus micaceus TaxID=71717 RepID=A0A4Y7T788_COPMI|nr:hypothetical protein FA13DRAFT_1792531 [Coprinellus micaceus]